MTAPADCSAGFVQKEYAMSNSQQPKQQPKSGKTEKGELSEASLKKVSGGNMPTAVERSSGDGGGAGRK